MISIAVRPGVEHENFSGGGHLSGAAARHKYVFSNSVVSDDDNGRMDDEGNSGGDISVNNNNNVIAAGLLTDKLTFGSSLVNVKGGPCSFSSASTGSSSPTCSSCQDIHLIITNGLGTDEGRGSSCRRESESYVAVKGQTLIVTKREGQKRGLSRRPSAVALSGSPPKTSNMDDSPEEGASTDPPLENRMSSLETQSMSDIEKHLHQMTQLLRPEDSIKLVVRLECVITSRIRYLAVVSCMEQEVEEYCLLGIDCQGAISLGLVLAILSHTDIRLDGDGGFCITYGDGYRSHIFKPVSVQTMWSALQSLYRASECAKKNNSYQVSAVRYYDSLFQANKSDVACLNEWNVLPGVEPKRPLISNMSSDELSFQERISSSLREILLSERDLDEVTSKEIRKKLEHKLQIDLSNYKPFIDEEMLKILGQMEAPAMILDNLYLGTEWNASHQQELFDKDIGYILNVTAEIDNFFPDTFRYMNIPVSDNEETDLLRYFNDSYRFINEAHKEGKNVLVHCKMGISRSATIVIAYVMKNRNWDLLQSIEHVKVRRTCVKPNPNFMKQLEVYEGILTAKRFSDTLEKRSKSESNLKQNDFSLSSTNKEANKSSSGRLTMHSGGMKKSPKKYYNTAPARLKPEKQSSEDMRLSLSTSRVKSTLSRPKSCSCAAISMHHERVENSKDDSFVQRDVMESFHDAVQSLENPVSPSSRLSGSDLSKQTSERSSLPNIPDSWLTSLPVVTVSPEVASNYVSKETVVLSKVTSSSSPETNDLTEVPNNQGSIPVAAEDEVDSSPPTTQSNLLKVPIPPDSLPTTTVDDVETGTLQSDQLSARITTPLKCCRRPFNGHTFSVSPNQVVNITSLGNLPKFSVRHLVNEFESHSSRNSLNIFPENSPPGSQPPSAIPDTTNISSRKVPRRRSREAHESLEEQSTKSEPSQQVASPSLEVVENSPQIPASLPPDVDSGSKSLAMETSETRHSADSSDSETAVGCLTFLKSQNVAPISRIDRSAIEAASNTISKLIRSHQTKKNSDTNRSREKVKDRGSRARGKLSHTVYQVKEGGSDAKKAVDFKPSNVVPGCGNMTSGVFQKTGVVKQRLQAFEAKSVPVCEQQYNHRSHNRSHSATGSTSSALNLSSKDAIKEKFAMGHKRKSSMPHLSSSLITDSSQSTPSLNLSSSTLFDRKGSLDSSTLCRSVPSANHRPFTVRGFQPMSSQTSSNKFPFSMGRHQRNSFGFNTSSTGARQQHGSTHPLKLLPQTTKLSQQT